MLTKGKKPSSTYLRSRLQRAKELTPVTGATITDEQIHVVRKAMFGVPRKNAYHRACARDSRHVLSPSSAEPLSTRIARYNKMLGNPT
jgi:hypothetical protein